MAESSGEKRGELRAVGLGERPSQGLMFVVSAPSGAGKTSLCTKLMERVAGLTRSISFTTRPLRSVEKDGLDYHFITPEEFRERIRRGEMAEWAEVHGALYGTGLSALEKERSEGQDVLLAIDTQGAQRVKERFGQEVVTIFLFPPSLEILEQRLREREADPEGEIRRRMAEAEREMRQWSHYDYVVVNDDFDEALEKLQAIILAERCRTSRFKRGETK